MRWGGPQLAGALASEGPRSDVQPAAHELALMSRRTLSIYSSAISMRSRGQSTTYSMASHTCPRTCGTPRRFPARRACAPSGPKTACRPSGQLVLAVAPGHLLDHYPAALPAVDAPRAVQEEHWLRPQEGLAGWVNRTLFFGLCSAPFPATEPADAQTTLERLARRIIGSERIVADRRARTGHQSEAE